jgi:LPXTG-motif cell wall-anchored protein
VVAGVAMGAVAVAGWSPSAGANGGTDADVDGYVAEVDDCDDSRITVNPGATEVALNGIDDDCDPLTPLGEREDFTCTTGDALSVPLALPSTNGYKNLNFSKSADVGLGAVAGDSFRYDQVGAIGGPTFDTGSVTAVSGSSPNWTATIQVDDTSGLTIGDAVTAIRAPDGGRIGNGGVYTITSVVDSTHFTISVEGGSSPQIGPIADIRTGTRVDALVTVVSVDSINMEKVDDFSSTGTSNRRLDVEHGDRLNLGGGTVENISGSGPWTASITGLASTASLSPGMQIIADNGSGSIGDAGTYVIHTVVDANSIAYTATGGTAPTAGSIVALSTWGVAEYRVDFLAAGTNTPVEVQEVGVSLQDIDDSQFVELEQPSEFAIDSASRIEILTTEDLAIVPSGWMRAWSMIPSSSSDPRNWIEAKYAKTSSISLRLGSLNDDDANYNVLFGLAGFTNPIVCQTPWAPSTTVSTTTYTGGTGVVTAGASVPLSADVDPSECSTPPVSYTVIAPDGSESAATSPLNTTGFAAGTYEIVARYPGSETCEPSEDRGLIVIAALGDATSTSTTSTSTTSTSTTSTSTTSTNTTATSTTSTSTTATSTTAPSITATTAVIDTLPSTGGGAAPNLLIAAIAIIVGGALMLVARKHPATPSSRQRP